MEKKGAEGKYPRNKAGNKTEESSSLTYRYPNMSKQRRGTSDLFLLQHKAAAGGNSAHQTVAQQEPLH